MCVCVSSPPAAKVACVKSRDMHWALVAHKDQKDINLSSLRMLLVADGSNPCKVTHTLSRPLTRRMSGRRRNSPGNSGNWVALQE